MWLWSHLCEKWKNCKCFKNIMRKMCVFVSPRLARTRGRHHAERIIYLLTLKCWSWLFGFVVRSAMCETKRLLIILSGRVKCVCLFSTSPAVSYLLSNYLAAQHEHQNSNKFFHSFLFSILSDNFANRHFKQKGNKQCTTSTQTESNTSNIPK